jgi:hypothetical protein
MAGQRITADAIIVVIGPGWPAIAPPLAASEGCFSTRAEK